MIMNDFDLTELFQSIISIISGNPKIWTPVLAAWSIGFLFTKYLNGTNLRRRRDREFRVYVVNFIVAFVLYIIFNFDTGITVFVTQATLAAAVAVLVPACWFWYQGKDK